MQGIDRFNRKDRCINRRNVIDVIKSQFQGLIEILSFWKNVNIYLSDNYYDVSTEMVVKDDQYDIHITIKRTY